MGATSNRREFLRGKGALRALEAAVDSLPVEATPPQFETEHYLLRLSRRAMACQFEVWLNAGQHAEGSVAAEAALELIDELEAQLSIYRESSELSQINRTAHAGPVAVEPRLFELLERASELWRVTERAFDITAGPLAALWGFKSRSGTRPAAEAIRAVLTRVGSQHVLLNPQASTVALSAPDMELNPGAIGKGYALDRAAEVMLASGVTNFLFHGGSSSVLARGGHGATLERGWSVGLRDPLRPERPLGEFWLRDRALATSGSGTQFFVHEGVRYGHILDPRTGWPAQGVLTATVVAPTAAEADALSTACYVLGPAGTERLCQANSAWGCLMVCAGDRTGSLRIERFGNLEQIWQPLVPLASETST